MQFLAACSLSRGVPSTSRPRLRASNEITLSRCRLGGDCTAAYGGGTPRNPRTKPSFRVRSGRNRASALLRDGIGRLRPVEPERLVQGAHGELHVLVLDDHRDLDLA